MKILKTSFLALAVGTLIFFANCGGGGGDKETEKEKNTKVLISSPWTFSSAVIPDGTATTVDDWDQLSVSFTATQLTTTGGYPQATDVWPAGPIGWTANDDFSVITRADGVAMTVLTLNESTLKVTFTLVDSEINARVASLDGDYTFTFSR